MPKKKKGRLSMRKIKEILRLNGAGLSKRQIAKSVKASPSTVSVHLSRAEEVGLTWPLPEDLGEEELMAILYPQTENKNKRPMPDLKYIHRELKRKSVTLQLLWEEYINQNPDGYRYSYFCELYYDWRQKLDLPLRQSHKAGEKVFVDFAGQTMQIVDRKTGEVTPAHIFIAVLGASNYTFARGVFSCDLENWVLLHCQVFECFGGAPEIIVPDNLRTAVTKTCRYEPDINPSFQEMAEHYGCAVIPGRPYKPKDKAKAENAVLFVERQILARLRNQTFFSLEELNNAIDEELIDLNERPFQKLEGSRKSWFETVDKPALKPLPLKRFELASWKSLLVN
ncbi:MAG: IS21 family transposase, partial [Candidatus Syntrophonatronum acetioxidans]